MEEILILLLKYSQKFSPDCLLIDSRSQSLRLIKTILVLDSRLKFLFSSQNTRLKTKLLFSFINNRHNEYQLVKLESLRPKKVVLVKKGWQVAGVLSLVVALAGQTGGY